MIRALALSATLLAAPAWAGTNVTVSSLSADGQELRDVSCSLSGGGFLASVQVISTVAEQKTALDACHPPGAAFRASWTWTGGATTDVEIAASSQPDQASCVATALAAMKASLSGTCSAVVLVGDTAAAEAAAATLGDDAEAPATPEEK